MEKFFGIKERGSTLRAEIIGGLTTFFSMAYIVFVKPTQDAAGGADGWLAAIMTEAGADPAVLGTIWNSVYIASILVAIVGTLIMALYALRTGLRHGPERLLLHHVRFRRLLLKG